MIQDYQFIDGNSNGDKERKTSSTTFLYNKLSAQETNNLRNKLNEVVGGLNFVAPQIFPAFKLLYKANGNNDQLSIESGDTCGRFDGEYIYNGGDKNDINSYTKIPKAAQVLRERFQSIGQDVTLPTGAVAIDIFVDGYLYYLEQDGFESDLNTFTQTGDVVTIKTPLDPNSQILILYTI
jgi:hypothetical protein